MVVRLPAWGMILSLALAVTGCTPMCTGPFSFVEYVKGRATGRSTQLDLLG